MSKTLIVAEKPSVARDIARVLGVKGRGEGCLVGQEYVVTWAIGHLVAPMEPKEEPQILLKRLIEKPVLMAWRKRKPLA